MRQGPMVGLLLIPAFAAAQQADVPRNNPPHPLP